MILGGLMFGLNLALFNFFMPLIFDADLTDLMVRTGVGTLADTMGALTLRDRKNQSLISFVDGSSGKMPD